MGWSAVRRGRAVEHWYQFQWSATRKRSKKRLVVFLIGLVPVSQLVPGALSATQLIRRGCVPFPAPVVLALWASPISSLVQQSRGAARVRMRWWSFSPFTDDSQLSPQYRDQHLRGGCSLSATRPRAAHTASKPTT